MNGQEKEAHSMTDTPGTLAERLAVALVYAERYAMPTMPKADIVGWRQDGEVAITVPLKDVPTIIAALRDADAAQQRVAELEAALREIVAKAEADLTYEGEFIDYIVPFEGIDRASALLAAGADR